ncbi:MAG TPA: phosphatase PAP2 family protein [Bryobacteraceae bacterium]|nr:phosphatase PAP2 family protein [Bryobacteraceae bacterium]
MERTVGCGVAVAVLAAFVFPLQTSSQTTQPVPSGPAAVPAPSPAQIPQAAPVPPQTASTRQVSWKLLLPNLLDDQKYLWSFPGRLAQGQNWIGTTAVLGVAGGLQALDPIAGEYFRQTATFHSFNNIFTSKATAIGTIVAPLTLYGVGLIHKDSRMQQTALFAGEAVADAEILATVMKSSTRRLRPADVPVHGNYWDTWFESHGSVLRGNGSFPSGHTIAAFSVATVVASRYRNRRWVPYVSYGLASLVGFSRLTLSSHFASDVFMGAALGYSTSRFAVLRQ